MPDVKLKFDGREIPLSGGVTTLGRTTDNDVSFPDDANVSRQHAEIESRNGDYVVIDLRSSNGTTVNGEKLTGERYLAPGDVIMLGGTSRIEFAGSENGANGAEPTPDAEEPKPNCACRGGHAERSRSAASRSCIAVSAAPRMWATG